MTRAGFGLLAGGLVATGLAVAGTLEGRLLAAAPPAGESAAVAAVDAGPAADVAAVETGRAAASENGAATDAGASAGKTTGGDTAAGARPFAPQKLSCTGDNMSQAGLVAELREAGIRMAKEKERLAAERADLEALKAEITTARKQLEELLARTEKPDATPPPPKVDDGGKVLLADAIRNMPPARASSLIATLSDAAATDVLRRLKPKDAGAILAVMEPARARALTLHLAGVNEPAGGAR